MYPISNKTKSGLLGDSPRRSYTRKLDLLTASPHRSCDSCLTASIFQADGPVAGCGLRNRLITVLAGRMRASRSCYRPGSLIRPYPTGSRAAQTRQVAVSFIQADMTRPPLRSDRFDLIWCSNTINHLRAPSQGIRMLTSRLRPGGRLVLGQSAFLPEMFFAWDARLEKEVMLACRHYYRDKYGLEEQDTSNARNLFGWMTKAGLQQVSAKTIVIERTAPLDSNRRNLLSGGGIQRILGPPRSGPTYLPKIGRLWKRYVTRPPPTSVCGVLTFIISRRIPS